MAPSQAMSELFQEITSKSKMKADKEKRAFNKKHKTINIPLHAYVMVRDEVRKSKLDPKNEGPFQIVGKSRRGSYFLRDNDGQYITRSFPPSALVPLSTNPTFPQDSYQVDKILEHEETADGMRYRVRWKNYPPENDTWEPEDNFNDQEIIHKYWDQRQEQDTR
jgi:hypothetical protein